MIGHANFHAHTHKRVPPPVEVPRAAGQKASEKACISLMIKPHAGNVGKLLSQFHITRLTQGG